MPNDTSKLTFKRRIESPPGEVYRAFTNAMALREWLCDSALVHARKGGRFVLGWNDGYTTTGTYTSLDPEKKVVFTWHGTGEPAETQVQVTLRPAGAATLVRVEHAGLSSGRKWRDAREMFEQAWESALENLQSTQETGQDLRLVRRPMLGISGGQDLTPALVAKLNVPVKSGVLIEGTVEGMGAREAGLTSGDVLVSLDGVKLNQWQDFALALGPHHAGDQVKVVYYRDGAKREVMLRLSPRSLPEIPRDPRVLADAVRKVYASTMPDLERSFEAVSEEEAGRQPRTGEWSAKEVLAHLIIVERDGHWWLSATVQGNEPEAFGDNLAARIQATLCAFPTLRELLRELDRNQVETVTFVENLPPDFLAHKATYWRMAFGLLESDQHIRDHIPQIQAALAAARA